MAFFNRQQTIYQNPPQKFNEKPIFSQPKGHYTKFFLLAKAMSSAAVAERIKVVGCCNGMVCILKHPATFFIWNPSIRMTKKLPKVSRNIYIGTCGFGRVESSGEYKVFASFYVSDIDKKGESKIYSSKTKSWKAIEPVDYIFGQSQHKGVFVGEKVHYYVARGGIIVYLDLKSEVFGRVEMPMSRWSCYSKWFGVLGGCPCVVLYNINSDGELIEVWVMKEYGVTKDCWERVVARDHVLELLRKTRSIVGPNGEILVFFELTFFVYNPQDNVFRLLEKYKYGIYNKRYLCIESLESPYAL